MSTQRSVLTSVVLIVAIARAASGATCGNLKSVSFPRTSISSAAVPQIAKHNGRGSIDDAANFECRNP